MPRAQFPTSCVSGATSVSLLESAKSHDPDAWRRLVELYGPVVFHWCQRAGLKPDDAADVVEDVFRAVAANIDRFERSSHSGSFRGWLATITTNKARDFARRRLRQPTAAGGAEYQQFLDQLPEEVESADTRASGNAVLARGALDLVAAEFEARTWQSFWQTTVESQSPDDVARRLGITVVAVHKARSRVLRRLREVLGEEV